MGVVQLMIPDLSCNNVIILQKKVVLGRNVNMLMVIAAGVI